MYKKIMNIFKGINRLMVSKGGEWVTDGKFACKVDILPESAKQSLSNEHLVKEMFKLNKNAFVTLQEDGPDIEGLFERSSFNREYLKTTLIHRGEYVVNIYMDAEDQSLVFFSERDIKYANIDAAFGSDTTSPFTDINEAVIFMPIQHSNFGYEIKIKEEEKA